MKEVYKVKPPEKVVFGDPMYFEQYTETQTNEDFDIT